MAHTIDELPNFNQDTATSDWLETSYGNGGFRKGTPVGWPQGYLWQSKRVTAKGTVIHTEFPKSGKGTILAIRTIGRSQRRHNATIRSDIRQSFLGVPCAMTGSSQDIEIDHRAGNKEHPEHAHASDPSQQQRSDFMPLCRSLNQIKRETCKKCVSSGSRPTPPAMVGKDKMMPGTGCNGCFWFEPELYF